MAVAAKKMEAMINPLKIVPSAMLLLFNHDTIHINPFFTTKLMLSDKKMIAYYSPRPYVYISHLISGSGAISQAWEP